MGFGHNPHNNNYSFWTFRLYDGNKTVDLIIEDNINQQKIPLTVDLRDYSGHWVKRSDWIKAWATIQKQGQKQGDGSLASPHLLL